MPCLKFPLWYSSVSPDSKASLEQIRIPQRPFPAERVYRVLCYNNRNSRRRSDDSGAPHRNDAIMPKHKDQRSNKPPGWRDMAYRQPAKLTRVQQGYAEDARDVERSVYNSAVEAGRLSYKYDVRVPGAKAGTNRRPTANDMAREFNAIKKEVSPYVTKVSKFVVQGAFESYDIAKRKWMTDQEKSRELGYCYVHGPGPRDDGKECSYRCGEPRFHRKKDTGTGSFLAATGVDHIKYDGGRRIDLPGFRKLPGNKSVKMARALPPDFIPVRVTFTYEHGRWMISVGGYAPPVPQIAPDNQSAVGVDAGMQPLAAVADSDGLEYLVANIKAYYHAERQLAFWQRKTAYDPKRRRYRCRQPGSRGWREAKRQEAKCHRRVVGLRSNIQHHLSKRIASTYAYIGIETLNVKGMDKLPGQAKAVRDAGIGTLLRQIRYKAEWYGATIVAADRWYPSSKTCSACGAVNAALGREPEWTCPGCGVRHDRNINAARNLLKLALAAALDLLKQRQGLVGT